MLLPFLAQSNSVVAVQYEPRMIREVLNLVKDSSYERKISVIQGNANKLPFRSSMLAIVEMNDDELTPQDKLGDYKRQRQIQPPPKVWTPYAKPSPTSRGTVPRIFIIHRLCLSVEYVTVVPSGGRHAAIRGTFRC